MMNRQCCGVTGEFGGLKWSNGEGHILFTAEKYIKKTEYFDADLDWSNEEKIIESNVGEKFRLVENWGEQRNEICRPMLCIMDVLSGSVTVIDQIPDSLSPAYGEKFRLVENWGEQRNEICRPMLCIMDVLSGSVTVIDQIPDSLSPAYSVWAPDDRGVVFFGIKNEPFKLGKIYCSNRRGTLYYYDLEKANLTALSDEDVAIEEIAFSMDNTKLVYFERPANGPHNTTFSLHVVYLRLYAMSPLPAFSSYTDSFVMQMLLMHSVPICYLGIAVRFICMRTPIMKYAKLVYCHSGATITGSRSLAHGSDCISASDAFPGFHMVQLPNRCWANDNRRVIVSSAWRTKLVGNYSFPCISTIHTHF
uniref:DUF295 domain-containing protein n=1 Tax=Ascaris lumbricoides TaxID=6252 RepID=A0A0M3IRW0_ASCLU